MFNTHMDCFYGYKNTYVYVYIEDGDDLQFASKIYWFGVENKDKDAIIFVFIVMNQHNNILNVSKSLLIQLFPTLNHKIIMRCNINKTPEFFFSIFFINNFINLTMNSTIKHPFCT